MGNFGEQPWGVSASAINTESAMTLKLPKNWPWECTIQYRLAVDMTDECLKKLTELRQTAAFEIELTAHRGQTLQFRVRLHPTTDEKNAETASTLVETLLLLCPELQPRILGLDAEPVGEVEIVRCSYPPAPSLPPITSDTI